MTTGHYLLTEEQQDLVELVRNFARKEIAPHAAEWDRAGAYPAEAIRKAMDMDLHLLALPEEYGGMGLDIRTISLIKEELGWADAGFAISISANMLGFMPLMVAGTEAQKKRFADIVVPGSLSAFCLTEAQGGSDAANALTTARRVGGEYVLNGTKSFITNGGVAGVYLVFAMTDKSKGAKGSMTAFLVERDREGISIGKEEDKMGIRSSNTTEVVFTDVRVPAENVVGREGRGFQVAMETLNRTRAGSAATAVGICQRAIDECTAYAKERVVFGRPIGKFQGVSFMLADMEIRTQAARQMMWSIAGYMDAGIYDANLASCVKTFAGDTAMQVTTDAVQIFSGYGYSREYPIEKLMRDAKIFQIFEGTNQIQRVVISGKMLK